MLSPGNRTVSSRICAEDPDANRSDLSGYGRCVGARAVRAALDVPTSAGGTELSPDMAGIALAHRIGPAVEFDSRRWDMPDRRRAMTADWGTVPTEEAVVCPTERAGVPKQGLINRLRHTRMLSTFASRPRPKAGPRAILDQRQRRSGAR